MRIVYAATDQSHPGRTGGSVHVLEVAHGLAARGHEVHAVVHRGASQPARERDKAGVTWHRITWFPPHRFFRLAARGQVLRLLREVGAEVVIERYYNFGGEGVLAADAAGVPALLEVNSPVLDHPGSWKAALDTVLLVHPMRRHRERLCKKAAALVSPLREIVPAFARDKTEIVTWGANVEAFRPGRRDEALRARTGIPNGAVAVLFSGSFRPWHGVHVFEAAARALAARDDLFFVLAGGPERGPGTGYRGLRLGALPYEQMPALTASCEIGVAPYDTERLAQLQLGFYWSPLKIFEYMASGLPTLTIPRPPLTEIVRDGHEALHFAEADPAALAAAIVRLAEDAPLRERLGAAARERVIARYSWAAHCAQLETVLQRVAA